MKRNISLKLIDLKSPDPVTREGAYSYFLNLIEKEELLKIDEKRELLNTLFSKDFLFLGIEKGESKESVARSFSLLVINLIFYSDNDFKLDISGCTPKLLEYLEKETDFRENSPELGYIHAFPHFSDLLLTLNWHKGFSSKTIETLTSQFAKKIKNESFSEEDLKRMNDAIKEIL